MPTDEQLVSYRAFREPYVGNHALRLLEALDTHHDANSPVLNAMPVVQASGMGKSRMVHEAAKLRFGFNVNLCHDQRHVGSKRILVGYMRYLSNTFAVFSSGVPAVATYILGEGKPEPDVEQQLRLACLLMAMFETAQAIIEKAPRFESLPELSRYWQDYLEEGETDRRPSIIERDFWEDAILVARNASPFSPPESYLTDILDFQHYRRFRAYPKMQVSEELKLKCDEFLAIVKKHSSSEGGMHSADGHTYTFVAFDNAQLLCRPPPKTEIAPWGAQSIYYNLGVVCSWLRRSRISFLFLSTSTDIISFTAGRSRLLTLPAYTDCPFDTFANSIYAEVQKQNGPLTLAEACSTKIISSFGRPA